MNDQRFFFWYVQWDDMKRDCIRIAVRLDIMQDHSSAKREKRLIYIQVSYPLDTWTWKEPTAKKPTTIWNKKITFTILISLMHLATVSINLFHTTRLAQRKGTLFVTSGRTFNCPAYYKSMHWLQVRWSTDIFHFILFQGWLWPSFHFLNFSHMTLC